MNSVQDWLEAYGESHQNPVNKKIHWVCVPLIMLSLLGLLWPIQFTFLIDSQFLNATTVLIAIVSIYYFRLSISMGFGMLLISAIMIFIITSVSSNQFAFNPYVVIFIFSWIGQFIGHKIEGKKPSFLEDIQFLLIGPAWLMSFVYDKFKIKY